MAAQLSVQNLTQRYGQRAAVHASAGARDLAIADYQTALELPAPSGLTCAKCRYSLAGLTVSVGSGWVVGVGARVGVEGVDHLEVVRGGSAQPEPAGRGHDG